MLKIFWLLGSAYTLFSVFKKLPPFKRRRFAVAAFVLVQAVSFGFFAAGAQQQAAETAQQTAPAPAAPPSQAPLAPEPDVPLIHTDPNAPEKPPSAAARADARRAREEMKEQITSIEAAALILKNGMENNNRDEVAGVREEMQTLQIKLINRKPPLGAEMTERDDEGFYECTTATDRLGMFADSALKPVTVQEVKDRMQFLARFDEAYGKCKRWTDGH